jgi:putative PIN family toxin of toxin-antitoxin system
LLRVTADTNILISGITFLGGKPSRLLDLARTGKINLAVSEAILDEMAVVLARKFHFAPEDVAEVRMRVTAMARTVKPAVHLDIIKEDPPDSRILECAVVAGSDLIVTGDKDLLRLKSYDSVRILEVGQGSLFVLQRHYGVQARGFDRRPSSKKQPDCHTDDDP